VDFVALQLGDGDGPIERFANLQLVAISDSSDRAPEQVLEDLRQYERGQGREPDALYSGREIGRALASMLPQTIYERAEAEPDSPELRFASDLLRGYAESILNAALEHEGVPMILPDTDGSP
jgi:hypothetical protein